MGTGTSSIPMIGSGSSGIVRAAISAGTGLRVRASHRAFPMGRSASSMLGVIPWPTRRRRDRVHRNEHGRHESASGRSGAAQERAEIPNDLRVGGECDRRGGFHGRDGRSWTRSARARSDRLRYLDEHPEVAARRCD
jgi:hypothetical protein